LRFTHLTFRVVAVLLLLAAGLVLPGCGGGGGGGGVSMAEIPSIPPPSGGGGGGVVDPLSPAMAPGPPGVLPPMARRALEASREEVLGRTVNYNLPAGWSLISFPLGSVTSASGFTYQLCTYEGTGYVYVDPVHSPGSLDTSRAYWAYADQPIAVSVVGPDNTGAVTTAHLQAGWNLLGCPSVNNLATRSMTVTRQAGATRVVEEAATDDLTAGAAWIYRYLYFQQGDQYVLQDLTGPSVVLQPRVGCWVFAWTEAELNLNVVPPSPLPGITSLSTTALAAGSTVDVVGTGLGDAATGVVAVQGVAIPNANILSWAANRIRFTVPAGLSAGNLVVMVNRYPSNRVPVTVTNPGSGSTGSLAGLVQSTAGVALSGAQIMVDSGHTAVSDANGEFRIDGIPAGDHLVYVTRIGHQTAVGQVTILAGTTRSVLVELAPATGGGGGGGGGETTGNLTVRGYPYYGDTRYWVNRIEIFEQGNYSERWSNTWYSDTGNAYNQLTADGAIVGRTYNIKITWRNEAGQEHSNTWYRTMERDGQTESFYGW